MILDTDVLIWFLRGNEKATNTVLESMPFSISVVTYMELLQGMRNKQEMESMKKAFQSMEVNSIPINEDISLQAAHIVEEYALSHSMEMADALIASTCLSTNEILFTANDKHYRPLKGIQIQVFRV